MVAKERLAGSLIELSFPAGAEIVREGETGDRFYIARIDGQIGATERGRPAGRGSLEYFGEIALLRDVPRTATITARTDVRLYALERDDFLAAVTGYSSAMEAGRRSLPSALRPPLPAELADRHELVARAARSAGRWCSDLDGRRAVVSRSRRRRRIAVVQVDDRALAATDERARRWRGSSFRAASPSDRRRRTPVQLQLLDDRQDALVRVEARRAERDGPLPNHFRDGEPLLDLAAHLVVADFGQNAGASSCGFRSRGRPRGFGGRRPAARERAGRSGRTSHARRTRAAVPRPQRPHRRPVVERERNLHARARTSLPQPCPRSGPLCAAGPRDGFPSRARSRGRRTSAGAHRRARPGGRWSPGRPARAPTAGTAPCSPPARSRVHRPAVRAAVGIAEPLEIRSTISSENVSPSSSAWTCASAAV